MYNRLCCVKTCRDRSSKRHRFPRDNDLYQKWIAQINDDRLRLLPMDRVYGSYRICEAHFLPKYIVPCGRSGLRKDAYPTLHLPDTEEYFPEEYITEEIVEDAEQRLEDGVEKVHLEVRSFKVEKVEQAVNLATSKGQTCQKHVSTMGDECQKPPLSHQEALSLCQEPPSETKDFIFQQTMYRIRDPRKSLPFYTQVLGMRLLQKMDFPDMKFSLYFMGYESVQDVTGELGSPERGEWAFSRPATVELTHNWGTENDPDAKYHNGNSEPRGFGHIGVMVPDVGAACERFQSLGVNFIKRPQDGKMKDIAFITDPDGYWIEIFNNKITGNIHLANK